MKTVIIGGRPIFEKCVKWFNANYKLDGILTKDESWWKSGNIKNWAEQNRIPLLRSIPEDYDTLFSIEYWEKVKKPKNVCVNLHQAELPRYRGCNMFAHAILNGDQKYGTTLHLMDEGLDEGDIIDTYYVPISKNDTAWTLYKKVEKKSFKLFRDYAGKILDRDFTASKQKGETNYYSRDSLKAFENLTDVPISSWYDKVRALQFRNFNAFVMIDGKKVNLRIDKR
jgi:hypothetical protein